LAPWSSPDTDLSHGLGRALFCRTCSTFVSTDFLCASSGQCIFGEPVEWFETARCLGMTLDTRLNCVCVWVCCSRSSSFVLWWITHVRSGGPLPAAVSKSCKSYNPSVRIATSARWYVGNRQIHEDLGFHSSPTTSEPWLRVWTRS
jgi:hypothetical protein